MEPRAARPGRSANRGTSDAPDEKAALEIAAQATTILLVEQNLPLVKRVAKNIIVMDQGVVVHNGTPAELADAEFAKRMLGVSGGSH